VSLNVLILAEDPVRDGYVLKPIIEAMMKAVGRPQAYVEICKDPRFRGTSQALKWQFIHDALSRNEGMFHLYILCVDRDGDANRQAVLEYLEDQARTVLGKDRAFLAENAWQEVEVWLLMGHDLPGKWNWRKIRNELHPKERYYQPFAESRGMLDRPGEGRDMLAREAASRYGRIRGRCKQDVQRLEDRVRNWIGDRK
jgi:hypothetical protein